MIARHPRPSTVGLVVVLLVILGLLIAGIAQQQHAANRVDEIVEVHTP